MAVKIKLKRLGKIRAPYYRIVVADSRTKRDGRAIEEIGKYHPKNDPSFIEVDSERAQHWLSVGAQPTDPVRKILEITGDWQKFKGLPGQEGTLRVAEPKADRKVAFAAALQETLEDSGATTRSKPRGKAAEPAASGARADKPAADKPAWKAERLGQIACCVGRRISKEFREQLGRFLDSGSMLRRRRLPLFSGDCQIVAGERLCKAPKRAAAAGGARKSARR